MRWISLFMIILFFLSPISSNAEWKNPEFPTKAEMDSPENQSDRIYAEVLSITPEGKKIAYIAYRGYAAYYQAKLDSYMRLDPTAIDRNVTQAVSDANSYMSTQEFKDSLISDFSKNVLKVGVTAALDALTGAGDATSVITNPAIDKGVDALGRRLDQPGNPPPLTSAESVPLLMMAMKECRDRSSSFGQKLCPEFERRLNVDVSEGTQNQHEVRERLFQDEVKSKIEAIDPELAQILESQDGFARHQQKLMQLVEERSGQLKDQIQQLQNAMQSKNDERVRQISSQISRSNLAAAFRVAGVLAQVTNNPKAAHTIQDIQNVALAIHDFANMMPSMAAAAPAMAANIFVGVVVLAYDLEQSSQQESSMSALQNQIHAIFDYLVQMKKDILDTLADFQFSMDERLTDIEAQLAAQGNATRLSFDFLSLMNQKITGLQEQVAIGFDSLSKIQLQKSISDCTHRSRLTASRYRECRDQFAALALGVYSSISPDPSSSPSPQGVKVLPWLAQYESGVTSNLVDPSVWMWGKYYLNLLNRKHPEWHKLSNETGPPLPGVGSIGLQQVQQMGQRLTQFMKTMAVTEAGALRANVFTSLLNRYARLIRGVIDESDTARRTDSGDPMPGTRFTQAPPPGTTYDFLKPSFQVVRCDGGGSAPTINRVDAIGYRGIDDPVDFVGDVRRWASGSAVFHLDKSFLAKIPNSVLWALKSNRYKGAQLQACFKQLALPYVTFNGSSLNQGCGGTFLGDGGNVAGRFTAELDVTIQLTLTYPDQDQPSVTHSVAAGTLKGQVARDVTGCFYQSKEQRQSPVDLIWNGGRLFSVRAPEISVGPPAGQNANSWLTYSLPDDQKANFNAFESDYANYLSYRRDQLESQLQPLVTTANSEITKTRAALLFLIKYGISSDDPAVTNLGRWLEDPLNLPDGTRYMKAMLEQGATSSDLNAYNTKMVGAGLNLLNALTGVENLKPGPGLL